MGHVSFVLFNPSRACLFNMHCARAGGRAWSTAANVEFRQSNCHGMIICSRIWPTMGWRRPLNARASQYVAALPLLLMKNVSLSSIRCEFYTPTNKKVVYVHECLDLLRMFLCAAKQKLLFNLPPGCVTHKETARKGEGQGVRHYFSPGGHNILDGVKSLNWL